MSEASESLKNDRHQVDEDGIWVSVSRQAIDEVLQELNEAHERNREPEKLRKEGCEVGDILAKEKNEAEQQLLADTGGSLGPSRAPRSAGPLPAAFLHLRPEHGGVLK